MSMFTEDRIKECLKELNLMYDGRYVEDAIYGCLMNIKKDIKKDIWVAIDLREYPIEVDYVLNGSEKSKNMTLGECRKIWDSHILKQANLKLLANKL